MWRNIDVMVVGVFDIDVVFFNLFLKFSEIEFFNKNYYEICVVWNIGFVCIEEMVLEIEVLVVFVCFLFFLCFIIVGLGVYNFIIKFVSIK